MNKSFSIWRDYCRVLGKGPKKNHCFQSQFMLLPTLNLAEYPISIILYSNFCYNYTKQSKFHLSYSISRPILFSVQHPLVRLPSQPWPLITFLCTTMCFPLLCLGISIYSPLSISPFSWIAMGPQSGLP